MSSMAPLGSKRGGVHHSTVEALKRQKVDGDESEYSDYHDSNSEFSENEYDSDIEDDKSEFDFDDFEGVDMTEDMLANFKCSYHGFLEELKQKASETYREPMLLEKPAALRPVPATVKDFWNSMPYIFLTREALDHATELNRKIVEVHDMDEDQEEPEDPEEMVTKEIEIIRSQIKAFEESVAAVEELKAQGNWEEFFGKILVVTDVLFNSDVHQVFSQNSPVSEVNVLLEKIGSNWKTALARIDAELGIQHQKRDQIRQFLRGCRKDLNDGVYVESHDNPFVASVFDWGDVVATPHAKRF